MLSKKKEEELVRTVYTDLYKAAVPSVDFNEIYEEAELDKEGRKDLHFNRYWLPMAIQYQIILNRCKEFKCTKNEISKAMTTFCLGASPSSSEKTWKSVIKTLKEQNDPFYKKHKEVIDYSLGSICSKF